MHDVHSVFSVVIKKSPYGAFPYMHCYRSPKRCATPFFVHIKFDQIPLSVCLLLCFLDFSSFLAATHPNCVESTLGGKKTDTKQASVAIMNYYGCLK